VTISDSHCDENVIMFELEDLHPGTEGYRNDAMSLHLFPLSIPSNRAAREKTTSAIDLVYSITVNSCAPTLLRRQPESHPISFQRVVRTTCPDSARER
jgi:hypothetical protein